MKPTPKLTTALKKAGLQTAFDTITRTLYSTDASIYQIMPIGVVWPRNTAEVVSTVKIASLHGVPILPRGAGTSLAGQAIGEAVILDFSRYMDGIISINPQEKTARVQPGVLLGRLNRALAPHSLMFGPNPASGDRATMGGIIGNNATGSHSILYGMTHDHLLGAETVLADASVGDFTAPNGKTSQSEMSFGPGGKIHQSVKDILARYAAPIASHYPKTFRSVAGYNLNVLAAQKELNLAPLLAGSEGTLGIITAATLNLVPRPKHTYLYVIHFDEMRAALESVPALLETSPSAVELMDKLLIDLTRGKRAYQEMISFIQGDPQAVLMVEYSGDNLQELTEKLDALTPFGAVVPIPEATQQAQVWEARKMGLGIIQSARGDSKPTAIIEDAAVPVEHLADYALEIRRFGEEIGIESTALYAHASAGCLHIRPMVNLKSERFLEQMRLLGEKSLELVKKYGGTISGEHGQGILRGEFSQSLFGAELNQAFREIKETFDPNYLFNPGKIIDSPSMDTAALLRYGPSYTTPYAPTETVFNFDSDYGFGGAVEMCNGAGVCRKLDAGVMCPSFQATRDEKHSTRGRANALRAAISGRLGEEGLTSQEVYEVMELCLSCQACHSECPSLVDMSKLKAEFLHQYYQEHGTPLRAWFFANVESFSKLAQPFAPVVNVILGNFGGGLLSPLGIHPQREMPAFARQRFTKWFEEHSSPQSDIPPREVVFFYDTYMEFNYPHIGAAAVKILEEAGFTPIVLKEKVDSGRPAVSKGLLKKAQRLAEKNIALLAPYAKQGIPIVGCEPSSVVMLVKEYPDLVPGADTRAIAEVSLMLDEFLVRESEAGNVTLNFDDSPRRVLFHGHCQQKANFGTEWTRKMLELIPNCTVEETESGCCGMAGAFGYEKEHYELSIQIAEMGVAPEVRAANAETIICAVGTSCREQIGHTTERVALHPIEVMADSLVVG